MASLSAKSSGTPGSRIHDELAEQKYSCEPSGTGLAFDKRSYSIDGLKVLGSKFVIGYMHGEFLFHKADQI
jgi:hypothetical protein